VTRYARVAVLVAPDHLDRPFDYRVPPGAEVRVGQQVRVVFAGRRRLGWVVDVVDDTDADPARIRDLADVLGDVVWFDADDLRLYRWVADRWAGTLADVLRHALPERVAAVEGERRTWNAPIAVTPADRPACPATAWRPYAASALLRAAARGVPFTHAEAPAFWWRTLPGDDETAMALDLIGRCLAAGRSALVLVPDPASPLPEAALALAGPGAGADLRTQGRARYRAFLRCRSGHARVAVGERGAAFAPLRDLGLVLVVDEASPAYKERRRPRHHARDVALARARMAGATCVVTGDLPSAALWRLLVDGHVTAVGVDRAVERARAPRIDVVDLGEPLARRARLAPRSARALSEAVRSGAAAVLVAARGGQGSALACRGCGHRLACPVCDGAVRAGGADGEGSWRCPACGWDGPASACPVCGDERTAPLAAGAGRYAQELARAHPDAEVARMEGFDAPGPTRRPAIGVMTRGSVVVRPRWLGDTPPAAIVLPDADAMLRRPALDASEDALRLWFALARWAVHEGGARAATVVLQTREPADAAVQALVRWDPAGFWEREAERRAELRFPPAASLIGLRAPVAEAAGVATALRAALATTDADVLGPDPDGRLLVKTATLRAVLAALVPLRHAWALGDRRVRIDVDPVELD
jgi:primosomal protein N' (replication factor Y) (superfamily II helicase)